ncbi:MAG: exosortase/archaeosortase family protein [archaeon]|jgi:exosortase/archaeosortase family protein
MSIKKKAVLKNSKKNNDNIFDSVKKYFQAQEEKIVSDNKKQLVFFVLGFVFFYLLITGLVLLIPSEFYKAAVGKSVQSIISLQGIPTSEGSFIGCTEANWIGAEIPSNCYFFQTNTTIEKVIFISWLCTGILEIIVLASAILASFGVSWKKKLQGILVAIILGVIFNLLRIVITVNIILGQEGQIVEFTHDLLFRVILFVYIVGFYVLWFYWANGKEQKSRK